MKQEELTKIIQEIRTAVTAESIDLVTITDKLTKISDENNLTEANLAKATELTASLSKVNQDLKNTNYDLFLKLGAMPTGGKKEGEQTEDKEIKFEELFNDKGGLK